MIAFKPMRRRYRFKNCPIGLFLFGDTVALMTEYATERKVDGQTVGVNRDAYIVSSGEYFWGGVTTGPERDELMVTPLAPAEVSDNRQGTKVADEEKTYILESTRISDENKATSEYLRDMIGG